MIRTFSVLLLLILGPFLYGQYIEGQVTDPDGNPIAYAKVSVEGAESGVICNEEGYYHLELEDGRHTILFQHLGYKSRKVQIRLAGMDVLNVQLVEKAVELETVEIVGDNKDPAYGIMKQLIEHKGEHVRGAESFVCQTYLKISLDKEPDTTKKDKPKPEWMKSKKDTLETDTIQKEPLGRHTISWQETQSTTYFQSPNQYKSVVEGYRYFNKLSQPDDDEFGLSAPDKYKTELNNPYLFYTDVSDASFNFYRNLISIPRLGDRPFISPLHISLWRITYKFHLEDRYLENGRVVYQIQFEPRNQDGPYFSGRIWVIDGLWVIQSVDLNIIPSTLAFFKKFHLKHQYEKHSNGSFILRSEEYDYEIKEGKTWYFGKSLARHSAYQLGVVHPKRFFQNELRSTSKEAFEKDSTYWDDIRPIALEKNERSFIQKQDSILSYLRSDKYLQKVDSVHNHLDILDLLFNGIQYRQRAWGMSFFMTPLVQQLDPAGIGGYRHRLGGWIVKNWDNQQSIRIRGQINYGFANQDFKGSGRLTYTYMPRRFGKAYVKFGNNYSLINDFATVAAFLSRSNFVIKQHLGVGHYMELINGLYLDASIEFADRQAIDQLQLAEWSQQLFGELNVPVSFDPYREFLIDLKLTYTPGQKYQMEPYRKIVQGSVWPTFSLQYKKAIPGILNSDIDYDFLEFNVRHEFRPGSLGLSRWTFTTGKFLRAKELRFTDFRFFRGSDPYIFANPLKAFELLGPTISTQNEYLAFHYLHDFQGTIMDKIPLLKRTRLQLSAGAGTLLAKDDNFVHSEVYAGMQHPFRIRKQRFKVGVYFVTAYSNIESSIDAQVKVGVSFFNPITNTWDY